MSERTIVLQITGGEMVEIAEQIGGSDNWNKLWNAIGYLSTWGAHSYPTVTIRRDGRGADLVAHYKSAVFGAAPGYTIGAVWHDTHYGFHS